MSRAIVLELTPTDGPDEFVLAHPRGYAHRDRDVLRHHARFAVHADAQAAALRGCRRSRRPAAPRRTSFQWPWHVLCCRERMPASRLPLRASPAHAKAARSSQPSRPAFWRSPDRTKLFLRHKFPRKKELCLQVRVGMGQQDSLGCG